MPYPETISYIRKQLEKGTSIDRIKKALSESGYTPEVIDELLAKAGAEKPEKKSFGIETLLKDAAIAAILIAIVGTLVYINFFSDSKTYGEKLSPERNENINLDLSELSHIDIHKDGSYKFDIGSYITLKDYDINSVSISYSGKHCINIRLQGTQVQLNSFFLPGCQNQENIVFTASLPTGIKSSDILTINII